MFKSVKELVEELFEPVAYSRKNEELKEKAADLLEKEYSKQKDSGLTDIQAMGYVMNRYGSLDSVCRLGDGSGASDDKAPMTLKAFKKLFRRIRILSMLTSIFFTSAFMAAFQGIVMKSPMYIITVTIYMTIGTGFFMLFRKIRKKHPYESICLEKDAKDKFFFCRDRHAIRLINSLFLLVGLLAYFVSLTFGRAKSDSMSYDELTVLVNMNMTLPGIGVFLVIKYLLDNVFLLGASPEKHRKSLLRYAGRLSAICGAFCIISALFVILFRDKLLNPFVPVYFGTAIFIVIGLFISYRKRKPLVRRNFYISKPLAVICAAAVLMISVVRRFQEDVYVLQPYLMQISKVRHEEHEIAYDEKTGVYTIEAGDDDFKILHLTDIHIGGSVTSSYKDYKAFEACRALIEYTAPDLVVVTGDLVFPMGIMSFSLNNEAPVIQFSEFMRNLGIPWAFTYGNHDTESMATGNRTDINELYKSLSFKSSENLLYPYISPDITGRCNQMIKIENPDGSIRQALFLIDSNDYTGESINEYDYIHDDQVDWYEEQVETLQAEQPDVRSMIFFHIPLQQYRTAYELYMEGSSDVTYFFGENNEEMIEKVCCSDYPSKLFDTAAALGSTKAMFCGHDHYNNLSVEYRGIRLTYGMSIDYLAMPGIDKDTAQRGGELITIGKDGEFEISQIPLTEIE